MSVTTVIVEVPVTTTIETPMVTSVEVTPTQATVVVDSPVATILTVGQQGPMGPAGVGGGATVLSLEAGEDLDVGRPVWVNANKFYVADNTTNFRVVGIITTAALTGLLATATIAGPVTLSGLVPNSPYFLGGGIITTSAPTSGYIIRMGQAVSGTSLLLNIEDAILLS